jgi:environmental stress-induced protein Ves
VLSDWQFRPATGHRLMPWANGGGTTAEVAVHPPGSDDWAWRLSIASVEADGPFSSLPGIDRHILVASGAGMALTVDTVTHELRLGSAPLAFAGEATTTCRLLGGPISDLNLMVRRDRADGTLHRLHLEPGQAAAPTVADAVAIVLLAGAATADGRPMQQFDALVTRRPGAPLALVAAAPTELAVACVYSRAPGTS